MKLFVTSIQSLNPARTVKIMFNGEFNEFVCELHASGKHIAAADYFTDSREDAFGTAKKMAESKTAAEIAAQMNVDRAIANAAADSMLAESAAASLAKWQTASVKRQADELAAEQAEALVLLNVGLRELVDHLPSFAQFEVSGTCHVQGLLIHWGCNGMLGMIRVAAIDAETVTCDTVFGTAQAVKACVRLFIEGDEGNQHLYVLAEAMQSREPALRFIP